jgi:NADPH:quinone reductase-like Zn-dependent oxidoreductase
MISVAFTRKRDGETIGVLAANNRNGDDLLELNKLVEAGKLRSVIDSRCSLNDAAAAIRRIDAGRPKGKAIISIGDAE